MNGRAPTTRYTPAPGSRVAYQVFGGGENDVVFVPSWGNCVDAMWDEPRISRFFDCLSAFTRVICFDKRGTGTSDPVPLQELPALEQWMEDVRAVMEAAASQQACLIGANEGGMMAMLFAATFPEAASSLILIDSCARLLRAPDYPMGMPAEVTGRYLARFEAEWGTGATMEMVAPSVAHDVRLREWYARYERLSLSPASARAMYANVFRLDLRPVLAAIRVPTLVLHRQGDRQIRVEHGRYLAQHIRDAKYVEIPGDDYYFWLGFEPLVEEIEEFLTGRRLAPERDRMLATVLFTDIVASTERAVAMGDHDWRDLLDAHHSIVRGELTRFRGREISTAGDGFFAVFDGPARAIRCASRIRDAVRALGLEIRAGLHTGEVEMTGDDVAGIAVHIGARVASAARPSDVVVSRTVVDLVAGSGISFEDLGVQPLKGVPGEWQLLRVASA